MSENFSVICRKIFRLFVDVGVYYQVSEPVHGIDEVDAGEAGKVLGTDIGFAEEAGDQQVLSHGTVQQWSGRGSRAPELSSHTMLVNVVSVIMRESPTPSEGVGSG